MFREQTKFFAINDVINKAIDKSFNKEKHKEEKLSLHILNDMTYLNIWNCFAKICKEQTELGFFINAFPLGKIYSVLERLHKGLTLRLSDSFLEEFDLVWDDSKPNFERKYEMNATKSKIQKLNLLSISLEMNLPKIYVKSAINNLFDAIGSMLAVKNSTCMIDLGLLGSLVSDNMKVSHVVSQAKNDSIINKKTTIKSLMGNFEGNYGSGSEDAKQSPRQEETKSYRQPEIRDSIQSQELKDKVTKNLRNYKEQLDKINLDFLPLPHPKRKQIEFSNAGKVVLVPLNDKDFNLKEMLDSTFQKTERKKRSSSPVLFNVYSNTRAAPFTSEKTQIPISHRISSFYTLSLQNFVIDKTSKSLKRLYDVYFYRHKSIVLELPATEQEEYLSLLTDEVDQKRVGLRKDTYKRYLYYINNYIGDEMVSAYKPAWLTNVVRMCLRSYNIANTNKYDELLNGYLRETVSLYKSSMKKSILDYILKHPEQREKLGIPMPFRKLKEYAEAQVSRPSEGNFHWKRNFNMAKVRISNNLMLMSENITKILRYFIKNLTKTYYLDMDSKEYTGEVVMSSFIDHQKNRIEDQKANVNEEWKKYIENVLKENKIYKDQLILYFKSVAGVMSSQLREMIIGSIEKYHDFIQLFRKQSYFEPETVFREQFNPKFPFQRSFIEVKIQASSDGYFFCFSDELSDIHNKFVGLIYEVVRCSQDVDRPDNMFIKNLEKRTNLWEVPVNDEQVTRLLSQIDITLKDNLDIINKVTGLYDPFLFVLSEHSRLEEFKSTIPKREEIQKKIIYYEQKLHTLRIDMPDSLYMNMVKINCSEINSKLREILYELICDLLKFVHFKNITSKAKEMNDHIEKLRNELSNHAQDEESLARLENDLEFYKAEKIPQLYDEYQDFLEWLFFYLDYDTYSTFTDTGKETMGGIETTIKTAHSNVKLIAPALENFESNLKEKRNTLEINLNKSRAQLNNVVTELRQEVEKIKEGASNKYIGDETGALFLVRLKELQQQTKEATDLLNNLRSREEYMNSIVTDDERIEMCRFDLEPLIDYVSFFHDYKNNQAEIDYCEIKLLDFQVLTQLIEKSTDLFDVSIQKIPTLKQRITRARQEFEYFKIAVELGKLIYSVVEILKIENLADENSALHQDNSFYCHELMKELYPNEVADAEKAQEILSNLKFKELISFKCTDKYVRNKAEVEKLVNQWQGVKSLYDILTEMSTDVEVEFSTENFKDKKYMIVSHSNFYKIKTLLSKNISLAEEQLGQIEENNSKVNIVRKVAEYKDKLRELLDIVTSMEENQYLLETHMSKASTLHDNLIDSFYKMKEVEKQYKVLIDHIIGQPKVLGLLSVRSTFKDSLYEISKILSEIPLSY